MKKNILNLLVTLVLIGCTQESNSDQTAQAKQEPITKPTNTNENNETNHTSIVKPFTPTVTQEVQAPIPSEALKKKNPIQDLKDTHEEEQPEKNILQDEEQDTTPPPPKSQEEVDDEEEAERTEAPIQEEDGDTIGLEKPAEELEDEAVTVTSDDTEESGTPMEKPSNELADEEDTQVVEEN